MKKLGIASLLLAIGGTFALAQPIAVIYHHDAAWCARMKALVGPMMPPVCVQGVQVDVRSDNPAAAAFVVVLNYTDADGSNPRAQVLAGVAHTSVGAQVSSVWFTQDVTDIKIVSAVVSEQVSDGAQVTVAGTN